MGEVLGIFVVYLVLFGIYVMICAIVGHEATLRGRSKLAYFTISFLISPILAGIILGLHGAAPGSPKALAAATPKR